VRREEEGETFCFLRDVSWEKKKMNRALSSQKEGRKGGRNLARSSRGESGGERFVIAEKEFRNGKTARVSVRRKKKLVRRS